MDTTVKFRAIILEDSPSILRLFTDLLTERGYETFGFSNPAICPLQLLPECRCDENQTCTDIIISDLRMPNITGLGFIEIQKRKKCKCRHIALVSASWTEKDLSIARSLGCKTFTKPFFFQELEDWLDEVEADIEPSRELLNWFQEQASLPNH